MTPLEKVHDLGVVNDGRLYPERRPQLLLPASAAERHSEVIVDGRPLHCSRRAHC